LKGLRKPVTGVTAQQRSDTSLVRAPAKITAALQPTYRSTTMKRFILAMLLASFAAVSATSFAAGFPNDQYRNTAGEPDQHQPQGD
jgi:hypothetical protein